MTWTASERNQVRVYYLKKSHRLRGIGSIAARHAVLRLLPILLLAACAQQVAYGPRGGVEIGAEGWKVPGRYYPPPGPPEDPWGPYIREAATRYRVPEQWVRAVMQQESGGEQQATSPVGAMGLMQVMPATYDELRARHGLGDDPYEPHNNILAGTAYIREMYDRYGSPGFLAAYNAGPDRVDSYLARRAALPDETVNYLAAITPNLGNDVPRSGPFAVYASARPGRGPRYAPTIASLAAGCDLNAAYDPNHPCTSLEQAARSTPLQTAAAQPVGAGGCDLDAAYDPDHPCTAASQRLKPGVQLASAAGCDANAAYNPNRPCRVAAAAPAVVSPPPRTHLVAAAAPAVLHQPTLRPSRFPAPSGKSRAAPPSSGGAWGIQVGAFANPGLARAIAEGARAQAPEQLHSAALALPPTTPFGGKVLYRARLIHLSESAASSACTHLNRRQLPCVVVPPSRS
jgi:D-alanyl-D-alanine carboxypeptidase